MRLLERDQNRISFQEFFSHPFIDLEHLPGPSCLEKAVRMCNYPIPVHIVLCMYNYRDILLLKLLLVIQKET